MNEATQVNIISRQTPAEKYTAPTGRGSYEVRPLCFLDLQ